jgi:hypothetical protein
MRAEMRSNTATQVECSSKSPCCLISRVRIGVGILCWVENLMKGCGEIER